MAHLEFLEIQVFQGNLLSVVLACQVCQVARELQAHQVGPSGSHLPFGWVGLVFVPAFQWPEGAEVVSGYWLQDRRQENVTSFKRYVSCQCEEIHAWITMDLRFDSVVQCKE